MFGAGSEGNDVLSLRQLNRAESPSGAMADARRISTSLTRAFPSMTVPLVGAPMDGASCGELAAGTARGGALGFIAGGSVEENGEKLAREVAIYRSKAPPGAHGDRLHAVAEALIVPTLGSGDAVTEAGVLVWDAPYKPVYVHPSAVHILHQLDGRRDVDAVAAEVGSPPGLVGAVLRQLVELGAATAG